MESCEIKNCRLCNKEGFIFCDIYHEVIHKVTNFIPKLINIHDESLRHITKVCTTCYQTLKTIVFNIENIMDTQKILRMENFMRPVIKQEETHQIVEDLARKYSNIKVKKISMCTASSSAPEHKNPAIESENSASEHKNPVFEAKSQTFLSKNSNFNPHSDHKRHSVVPKIEASPEPARKIVVVEAIPEPKIESSLKKSRALMCITCSQKFTSYNLMENHLKTCKASPNNLKCFCGKVLSTKKELALHVYSQHKQNKQNHVCKTCSKVFTSMFDLQNHMVMHRTPVKGSFACHQCKGKFFDLEAFKKHNEIEKCGVKKAASEL